MTDQPIIPSLGKLSRFATLLAAAGVLMSCSASAAATLPATPLTLPLVLLRAKGGDTVVLTGEFGDIGIKDRKFSPALNLDLSRAKLTRLGISGSKGVHVKGGEWVPGEVKEQVLVALSDDVTFDNAVLRSEGKSFGFRIADSSNVAVTNSQIERPFQGINSGRVHGASYVGNTIKGTFNDSIVIYANEDLRIENNDISGNNRVDKRHPDGVQFIYRAETKHGDRSKSVIVKGNTISGATQGIFGGGIDGAEIIGNTINIDHGNAIRIGDCTECRVIDNRISTLPEADNRASIMMKAPVVRCGNRVGGHAGKPAVIDPPCLKSERAESR